VSALAQRARELEARLESIQSRTEDAREESAQAGSDSPAGSEADLEHTRAVNARLRAEMTELLSFLDELNGILAAAAR